MQENEIIELFYDKNQFPQDDCFFEKPNRLITTDSLVEDTHFKLNWSSPSDLAGKLLEVNISDILASGGFPQKCLLNLGFAKEKCNDTWVQEFAFFFRKKLQKYQIKLIGGDTFHSEKVHLTLTLFGHTTKPIFRHTAKSEENIYISGVLGFSYLGYEILQKREFAISDFLKQKAIKKHLEPQSRFELAKALFSTYEISSNMDISDGFYQDLQKLCKSSQIGAEIYLDKFPKDLQEVLSMEEILSSGEELEFLFTSKQTLPDKILDIPIWKIGRTTKSRNKIAYFWKAKPFEMNCEQFHFLHFK